MAIHESPMVSKYDPFFAYKKAICPICFCPICPVAAISFCNTLKNNALYELRIFTGQIGQKQIGQIHFVGKKMITEDEDGKGVLARFSVAQIYKFRSPNNCFHLSNHLCIGFPLASRVL